MVNFVIFPSFLLLNLLAFTQVVSFNLFLSYYNLRWFQSSLVLHGASPARPGTIAWAETNTYGSIAMSACGSIMKYDCCTWENTNLQSFPWQFLAIRSTFPPTSSLVYSFQEDDEQEDSDSAHEQEDAEIDGPNSHVRERVSEQTERIQKRENRF